MININIKSEDKTYPIIIKNEDITELKNKIFSQIGEKKYLVVISEKVEKLYGKIFVTPNKYVLKDGEKQKNFSNYRKILEKAFKLGLTRDSYIVAIGGGVVGDLAGFVAATYMRGIKLIQVPTTLLSCIDSSVGGKTAINTSFGKNLVGAFYQPNYVFINPQFIKTLDDKQYKSGLGEAIKYAFIEKSCKCEEEINLINFLSEKVEDIQTRDEKTLSKLIEYCVKLKKSVVEKDEKESELRKILNFGHTYGHAVEQLSSYKYTHGEAVVDGIKYAFDLALEKNLIDKNYRFFALDVIKKFNIREVPNFNLKKVIKLIRLDKKSTSNSITFILPTDYSQVEIHKI